MSRQVSSRSASGFEGVVRYVNQYRAQVNVPVEFADLVPKSGSVGNQVLVLRAGVNVEHLADVRSEFLSQVDQYGWERMIHEVVHVSGHYKWGEDQFGPSDRISVRRSSGGRPRPAPAPRVENAKESDGEYRMIGKDRYQRIGGMWVKS